MSMVKINIDQLARQLEKEFPEVLFAFLFGSARDGKAGEGSDIDLAVYVDVPDNHGNLISRVLETVESLVPDLRCDLTILNSAGSLIAFEALSGTELFIRKEAMEKYLDYRVKICRSYEEQVWWMKKQLEYRGYEVQWDY